MYTVVLREVRTMYYDEYERNYSLQTSWASVSLFLKFMYAKEVIKASSS